MKKNLFALFIALLSVGQMFGGSTYYQATMNVNTSSQDGTGNGTVYIGTKGETSATAGKSTSSEQDVSFELYAEPNDGSTFLGWNDGDGVILGSNSSPWSATVKTATSSDAKSSSGSDTYYTKTYSYTAVFKKTEMVTVTFMTPQTGSYTLNGENVTSDQQMSNMGTVSATLVATPQQNYKFLRWWKSTDNGVTKVNLGFDAQLTNISFTENCIVGVEFIPTTTPVFIVKGGDGTMYTDLNAACAAANNVSEKTVVLFSDGTLPAGTYTIPQGVTLLIPFDDEYSCYTTEPMILHGWRTEDDKGKRSSVTDPSTDQSFVYSTLTLASGAQLNIEGIVSLSAKRWCVINTGVSNGTYSNANPSGSNRIYKGFGLINMENNSSIQVKSGGKLYCWGRIRGEGAVIAKSGAEVRESYVYTDWRNNDYFKTYVQKTRCFPQNQYYIQDIQVPITYESGATCNLVAALFYSSGTAAQKGTMNFVGTSNSFIELPAGATMTKKYVASEDRLYIDLENGASFNNFSLNYSSWKVATSSHIFTITNNWTVNINNGTTNMTYDLAWAPGAVLNIKQGAAVTMLNGMSMYVYDHEDWGDFAAGRRIQPLKKPSQEASYGVTVKARTYDADCPDAEFIVDGTLTVTGGQNIVMNSTATNCSFDNSNKGIFQSGLYTTEAGANIHGIGTIRYLQGCGDQTATQQLNLTTDWNTNTAESNIKYYSYTPISRFGTGMARPKITPAKLNNGTDYTETAYSGNATFQYFTESNKWKKVSKVTFVSDGQEFAVDSVAEGETITPPTELPTKAGYELTGWSNISNPMGTTDIISEAQWEQIVVSATTIEVTPTKVIKDDGEETSITDNTYIINEKVQAEVVKVDEGATIEIATDASLAVSGTLVINASENNSGDLLAAEKIEVADNAEVYFDYTFNTPAMRWNAIAFPWKVDATSGVQVDTKTLVLGKDFDIIYYDGTTRAAQGPVDDCWKYVEDDGDKTLVPGRLYMILFAQAQNIVRFVKKTDAPLVNTEVNVEVYSGNNQDANWNGIANPTLYHAYLGAGVEEGQVYNNADDSYSLVEFADTNFPVGKPVFVQAAQEQSVVVSKDQPANAPMRAASSTTNLRAEIEIIANNIATDKVIVRTDEEALNGYTIGSDLAKAGVSSKVAQLWVNRYGTQLCKNTIAPLCDVAEYPLTIFAPTSGVYTLAVRSIDSDCALYLTQNGEAIADLTSEDYTLNFTKGNHSEYGLRMVIKRQPGVVTSFDEALTHKDIHKVIYRKNLYIIRNKHIYNVAGQFIK